jgi:glucosamine-6-phosphate deaminase
LNPKTTPSVFKEKLINMKIKIYQDYDLLSQAAADIILKYLQKKPNSLVCIGSGDTPKGVCQLLVEAYKNSYIDFSETIFIVLDEWIGMDENDEGSCKFFVYENLYKPLSLKPEQIQCFNAKSMDLAKECTKINDFIEEKGGIDVMLVGIGMNGHIALNEPFTSFNIYAHVSELAETTKTVGQKYFNQKMELTHGITLGLAHLKEAKLPILMANGVKKAKIIQKTIKEPVSVAIPSSIFQTLLSGLILLDQESASLLT